MMLHRMTLLALKSIVANNWTNVVAILLVVHPIQMGEGADDYIAMVLNTKLSHYKMYVGVQNKGI